MTGSPDQGWGGLLAQIGAVPANWTFSGVRASSPPQWLVTLEETGIDVSLDDLEVDPSTGLYLYKTQQVLIYIKYTRREKVLLETNKQDSPRFHFMDCKTIQTMKQRNLFQRYVAIARTDGLFPVVSQEQDGAELELEAKLGPCKNCLSEVDYKDYDANPRARGMIWKNFSIEEFFSTFSSSISAIPADSCVAIDSARYAAEWPQISEEVRARAGWRCLECKVDVASDRRLLHVHHVDRDKTNNWRHNLQPLCLLCHREQPGHKTMYVSFAAEQRIVELRRTQGLRRA
jgi:hypothetical protein